MTVRELIVELGRLPPDALLVQAADAEGNGFAPVRVVTWERYAPDTQWGGRLADGRPNAVVLWPAG